MTGNFKSHILNNNIRQLLGWDKRFASYLSEILKMTITFSKH